MTQIWDPPNISPACAEAHGHLTQCSQIGYLYLTLLAQLFGSSLDTVHKDHFMDYREKVPQFSVLPMLEKSNSHHHGKNHHENKEQHDYKNSEQNEHHGYTVGPIKIPIKLGKFIMTPIFETPVNYELPFRQVKMPISHEHSQKSWSHHVNEQPDNGYNSEHGQREYKSEYNNHGLQYNYGQERELLNTKSNDKLESPRPHFIQKRSVEEMKFVEDSKKQEKRQNINDDEYDFIVVGAGSAGSVVASRLSEIKKWKILLLEAGPEQVEVSTVPGLATSLQRSNIDWLYMSQPEKRSCRALRNQRCVWYRGRQMGGSSSIIYMRGNKQDYDGWADLGNHGWSYKEVLPYFKKSENNRDIEAHDKRYHATGGPLNIERYPFIDANTFMIVDAFQEKGLPITDFNGANQIGTNVAQAMSIDGKRMSNNDAFIRPIRYNRPNLKIITNAQATKVLIDPSTKLAHGVEYLKNGYIYKVFAKKEVIVSAGTLNTPKLLMLSGVGPKHHLESFKIPVLADLGVGYNLQAQVSSDGLTIALSNTTSTWVNGKDLLHYVEDYYRQPEKKNGPLSASGTLSGTAFIKTKYAKENAPDIQFHFEGRTVKDFYTDPTTYMATRVFPLSFYDGLSARPLLLTPKSRGVVRLNSTDPVFGMPMIYPRFFTEKEDIEVLLEGFKFVLDLENTEAFKQNGARFVKKPVEACKQYKWGTDDYIKCLLVKYTSTLYHPIGTAKMGPKWDEEAVVDPRLKVYGIKHLRVIDGSIIPVMVRANTNTPVTMIAEKGADMIKEDWLHERH